MANIIKSVVSRFSTDFDLDQVKNECPNLKLPAQSWKSFRSEASLKVEMLGLVNLSLNRQWKRFMLILALGKNGRMQ